MVNINKNGYNTTQLTADQYSKRQVMHRDILAHHLRWTHVAKFWGREKKILDVGCGKDAPMCMALYSNKAKPSLYVGLEYRESAVSHNKENIKTNFPTEFYQVDLIKQPEIVPDHDYDIITCFEVIEHVDRDSGLKLLDTIAQWTKPHTKVFLSTPCFNGSAAENHVYEWRYDELKEELSKRFNIEAHYGTFASQKDILPHMSTAQQDHFAHLQQYYDTNTLAVLFAPLFPQFSRNCIWHLTKATW